MTWSRKSRHERGYGSQWDKVRLEVLKRDGYLCQCPDCLGGKKRLREATEVDHIVQRADFASGKAKGDADDPSNLRAINSECHRRLTILQRGDRVKPEIGLDGYPVA
jgi:5-methylcytosine-specific restriction enzyme A